ncbi:hypothetical protein RRG08_004739 [Elysia crispata]|uniref:Uncharacterized protein n=1 Tax=Elysia crispata TaxID=231223 RepID=A0AAE1DZ90_9GAST|nr:hypothetical protein RRG08_004739 [Elysia crispata]
MIVRVSTAEGGSATGAEGWDTLMTYWTVKLGHSRRAGEEPAKMSLMSADETQRYLKPKLKRALVDSGHQWTVTHRSLGPGHSAKSTVSQTVIGLSASISPLS